jgi:anthranilate phosphoribosyltransferase
MLKPYLNKLVQNEDLSRKEASDLMDIILEGKATDAQIGAFLTALKIKGETSTEIAGFAETLIAHADHVAHDIPVICPCGTGGDMKGTINVSTAVSFILAAGGVGVAKHGNRSVSSSCGTADVLAALGVDIDKNAKQVSEEISRCGLGFLFAPNLNKAMKYVAKPRKELGFRTVFNMLGPIINPAKLDYQLVGIYDQALVEKVAEVLREVGVKQAMVIASDDGMDEISTAEPTKVAELKDGAIKTYKINPLDYGFKKCSIEDYAGSTPENNAKELLKVFGGEKGAKRDIIVMNAGAAFYISNRTETIADGIKLAEEMLDSGKAKAKLDELIKVSQAV